MFAPEEHQNLWLEIPHHVAQILFAKIYKQVVQFKIYKIQFWRSFSENFNPRIYDSIFRSANFDAKYLIK